MVDFAKLKRPSEVAPKSPFAYTDEMHFLREFKDATVSTGEVTVTLDRRLATIGLDDLIVPATSGSHSIELLLRGERADVYRDSVEELLNTRRTLLLEGGADFDTADAVSMKLTVEGYWKPRFWKGSDHTWQKRQQLHITRFWVDGTEYGRVPRKD